MGELQLPTAYVTQINKAVTSALKQAGVGSSNSGGGTSNEPNKCTNCNRLGYSKKNCWRPGGGKHNSNNSNTTNQSDNSKKLPEWIFKKGEPKMKRKVLPIIGALSVLLLATENI